MNSKNSVSKVNSDAKPAKQKNQCSLEGIIL
jgi:hypothetical protein